MGDTRYFKPFCSKCKKARMFANNIEIILKGKSFVLRCCTCGHEYKSQSKTALRMYAQNERK